MASYEINVTEAIAQIAGDAARMAIQTMTMASAKNNQRAQNMGSKIGSLLMRQPTFDWSSTDKYAELRNFRMEVKNMFQNYNVNQTDMKNWLGRQGLQHKQNKKHVTMKKVYLKH